MMGSEGRKVRRRAAGMGKETGEGGAMEEVVGG
jgi:hypothetical protein